MRREPRKDVPATLREGNQVWTNVSVHLKGAVGSFRSLDDKPSLTLNFDRSATAPAYHGLSQIHLNNSVEDPTFLNERIGSELFAAAGVPVPRVGWATLEMNGRNLGLYVLKEGFAPELLGLWFTNAAGSLYEGSGHEVTEVLKWETGTGPENQADLDALARAVLEPEASQRWPRLEQTLDRERFLSFMAMEVLVCHRDGYCLALNNYRIYCDHKTGKALFLPHGMDQLFGRPDALIQPAMAGLVAQAVIDSPEGRLRYRQRLGLLLTNILEPAVLNQKIDQWSARLRTAVGFGRRGAYDREVAALKQRIVQRHDFVAEGLRR